MIQCDISATEKDAAISSQLFYTVHHILIPKSGLKQSSYEIEAFKKFRVYFMSFMWKMLDILQQNIAECKKYRLR